MGLNQKPFTEWWMEEAIPSSSLKANMDLSLALLILLSGNLLKMILMSETLMLCLSHLRRIRFIDSFPTKMK